MGIADVVGPQLPYLRRFSRALTGSQAERRRLCRGAARDARRRSDQPSRPVGPTRASASMACFAACGSRSASTSRIRSRARAVGAGGAAQARQHRAAPAPGLPADRGRRASRSTRPPRSSRPTRPAWPTLLDEASREIGEMMATDVLIIEDEPLIAMDIEDIVTRLGHRVTGIARTRQEAVKLAAAQPAGHHPRRHPARRRQLRHRRGQRPPRRLRGAGHLHHRLSRSGC